MVKLFGGAADLIAMSLIPRLRGARRPRTRPVAALLAATSAVLVLLTGASPASAAEPGVNLLTLNSAPQTAATGALGTHWVRLFMTWKDMEPARGVWAQNWFQYYEREFAELPAGTHVVIDVVGTPAWETGSSDEHTPPYSAADFASFIGVVAHRFGPRVAAYEIWNEEDASRWWSGGPDAAAYTRLLQAAYPAIKAAEPSAKVVLGGLTGNDYLYLEGVYAAGGKGYFDAVGVHTDTACNVLSPYEYLRGGDNRMIVNSFLAYREVHQVMLANGDPSPIWMTEFSWRTTTAVCGEGAWAGQKPEGVSEPQQATYLRQALHCMDQDPYVQVALWFPLQDEGGIRSGLVRANGSRKPSFGAMAAYMREGDTLTEPCGVFTGPAITVASPGSRTIYNGPLAIRVSAHSSAGVFRIRLLADGRLIRNYDGRGYPSTLNGAIEWMGAKRLSPGWHTLSFLAYDRMRNVSRVDVRVFHGPRAKKASHRHRRAKHARRTRTRR